MCYYFLLFKFLKAYLYEDSAPFFHPRPTYTAFPLYFLRVIS